MSGECGRYCGQECKGARSCPWCGSRASPCGEPTGGAGVITYRPWSMPAGVTYRCTNETICGRAHVVQGTVAVLAADEDREARPHGKTPAAWRPYLPHRKPGEKAYVPTTKTLNRRPRRPARTGEGWRGKPKP